MTISEEKREYQLKEWSGESVDYPIKHGVRGEDWQNISTITDSESSGRHPVLH